MVTTLDYDDYVGRIAIGRVIRGKATNGQQVLVLNGEVQRKAKLGRLYTYQGLKRTEVQDVALGDIVAITGLDDVNIGETIADTENPEALPTIDIDEPTLAMTFSVNNSPLAGREGQFITTRHLRDRLFREVETNVSLKVRETESADTFEVSGRGELHLSILIETMRREGFEFQVGKPEVIYKTINGQHLFHGYAPYKGDIPGRSRGALVAFEAGETTGYGIFGVQERGTLFIVPGQTVYEGSIIGENTREMDMDVNPCKKKNVTNMRTSASDEALRLTAPRILSLEQALEYINKDELVEVTPKSIRLRKAILSRTLRGRERKNG
ncbi:MAG: GTP-binding protein TypA [Firmicutes bacterium]|nr:GTP-binding protein TypA [Bacillota bacterium]